MSEPIHNNADTATPDPGPQDQVHEAGGQRALTGYPPIATAPVVHQVPLREEDGSLSRSTLRQANRAAGQPLDNPIHSQRLGKLAQTLGCPPQLDAVSGALLTSANLASDEQVAVRSTVQHLVDHDSAWRSMERPSPGSSSDGPHPMALDIEGSLVPSSRRMGSTPQATLHAPRSVILISVVWRGAQQ